MSVDSLRTLARHLGVPERTLRRAAAEGLIRGQRISERRFKTTLREEAYLRGHWALLSQLRASLRTEPNVRSAVLFGSAAIGQESERSDVDLLVWLRDPSAAAVAGLAARLNDRIAREVQLVRVQDAERSPALVLDVLEHGRVIVDRDGLWPTLTGSERSWRRRADADNIALEDSMPNLELS
ncbi:MAG: nucleotidyltransferase family protein [Solirubrobacteraceae bacterium]